MREEGQLERKEGGIGQEWHRAERLMEPEGPRLPGLQRPLLNEWKGEDVAGGVAMQRQLVRGPRSRRRPDRQDDRQRIERSAGSVRGLYDHVERPAHAVPRRLR